MRILKPIAAAVIGLLVCAYAALTVYAYLPVTEVPARELAATEDRFVAVDGLSLRYRQWGQPVAGKPSLLMLHGFANTLQTFRLLAPQLEDDWHVVALDLPGFGLSSKPADHDYHNDAQARSAVAFASRIGLGDYVIAGHSMGGAVAVHVAASDPAARGMILFNPGIITTGVPALTRYLFFPLPRVTARMFGDRGFRTRFLERSFVDLSIVTESVIDDLMLSTRSEGYMTGTASLMRQYAEGAELRLLPELDLPTLIVWGELDAGKPEGEAEKLSGLIAGSILERVPGAGHFVHEEAPEAAAVAVHRFLVALGN